MRILVNYSRSEQAYLPVLQYHLKQRNIQAIATELSLTPSELVMKAKGAKCDAILLCNTDTLVQCVPGKKPTLDLYRGSVLNFSVPTVICNSLTHTQTVDHGSWLLGVDIDKLSLLSEYGKYKYHGIILETTQDRNEAWNFLRDCVFISYDIETNTVGGNDETFTAGETFITCASWTGCSASGQLRTFIIPFVDFLETHWTDNFAYEDAILFLRKVNALPIPKVMHNGIYDALHSITYHAEPHQYIFDTMAMAWSQYSSLPKTLDFVASITLPDYCQWKTEAGDASKNKDILAYWHYNGKDTWYTARIFLHYLKHLPPYARKNYAIQFPLVYPSLYGAFEGILIDQQKRTELRSKAQDIVDNELAKLRVVFADEEFKPSSPKQVQHYIYDIFGAADPRIGQRKDAKTGKRTRMERGTDEKNLRAIGQQHPLLLRITDSILNYRENAKAISTYFDYLQLNGRLLWSLNPFGTDTGRMSCSSSSFWCGTQVQNIPPYAKNILVADPDYTLIEFDNSQSEARCTAYLAQETSLIKALEDKEKDFYTSLGTLFFQIPYEQVTKDFRNKILKKIVHGTNYMMGAGTFIENAGTQNLITGAAPLNIKITLSKTPKADEITLKAFATSLLESYHKPFPRVREWYKEIQLEISTTKMLRSPLGWTRYFFGDISKDHNMLRSAVAHAPQNLSVQVLNIGMWKIWQLVKASGGKIRFKAQIHDSIFLQIHNSILEQGKEQVYDALQNPVKIHGRSLLIPVDYKYGTVWGSMTEVKRK